MPLRVLLVDDEPAVLRSLGEALVDMGTELETASSAEAALTSVAARTPDLVLSDIRMPGTDGLALLESLRRRAPSVDVVLMTAYEDMATVVRAMREGARDFLVKPIDLLKLEHVLRRVSEDRRARAQARPDEARPTTGTPDGLIGRDPKMIEVFKLIGQSAASRVNVLIRGESGTGKEVVARAIHTSSADRAEPFVAVNCTALPETLLESELFGHVRGAFTGAASDRRGRFALARRGTIFLDEIGDTALEFQAKILRVLEGGEFFPVGGERAERTDARVITATHRDLEARVADGTFREDLYYRLRVVEIVLPPLRERPGDIPLLAHALVARASHKLSRPAPALSEAALEALMRHDWPGNVRELENCLIRAIALGPAGVLRPEQLNLQQGDTATTNVLRTLDEVELEHVQRVLAAVDGNKARAARVLGISKTRLYRLLEKRERGS